RPVMGLDRFAELLLAKYEALVEERGEVKLDNLVTIPKVFEVEDLDRALCDLVDDRFHQATGNSLLARADLTISMASSTSFSVVGRPRLKRIAARASASVRPIALST